MFYKAITLLIYLNPNLISQNWIILGMRLFNRVFLIKVMGIQKTKKSSPKKTILKLKQRGISYLLIPIVSQEMKRRKVIELWSRCLIRWLRGSLLTPKTPLITNSANSTPVTNRNYKSKNSMIFLIHIRMQTIRAILLSNRRSLCQWFQRSKYVGADAEDEGTAIEGIHGDEGQVDWVW